MMMILIKEKKIFEEEGNKCLIYKDNHEEEEDEIINEIYNLYTRLHNEFKKCLKKNVMISKQITSLDLELKLLKTENKSLVKQTNKLRTENDSILNENNNLKEKLVVLQKEKEKLALDLIQIPNYTVSEKKLVELQKKILTWSLRSKILKQLYLNSLKEETS